MFWKKKKKKEQRTFCFCPTCHNELISSNSFVKDTDYVYYECTKCGHPSKWDFDTWMVPLIVDEQGRPMKVNFEAE